MLEPLGVTATAEAVYRAMLDQPAAGVDGIAAATGLTELEVRDALDELADLELLHQSLTASNQPRPVHAAVGLATLLAQAEADVLERQAQLAATRAAIAAIVAEHESNRGREQVVKLDGIDAVRGRIAELAQTVNTDCVSLNPGAAQTPDAKSASKPLNQRCLERGVAIRCVYQESYRNDPALVEYARWFTDLGGQLRTAPTLPMLMIVYDREVALLPIDPVESARGAIEIRNPGIVAATFALFEQIWLVATPFGVPAAVDADGLESNERDLIRILANGYTDEVAARRLGVSLRTVRRMAAEVMERLGARSRFQAGVLAARRGWLDVAPGWPGQRQYRPGPTKR